MGLEAADWQVVYANDWSAEREQMYKGFFGESYLAQDVFSLEAEGIPQRHWRHALPLHRLVAGRKGEINGRHSGAFWGFYEILKKQGENARRVLLENVTGWLIPMAAKTFALQRNLLMLGYACDVFMLNARSFVPQSRPRLFMTGVKSGVVDDSPYFTSRSKRLMPPRLKMLMLENEDIQWARLDIPEPPPYRNEGFTNSVVERLTQEDPRWWSEQKVEKHLAMMPSSFGNGETIGLSEKGKLQNVFPASPRRRAESRGAI